MSALPIDGWQGGAYPVAYALHPQADWPAKVARWLLDFVKENHTETLQKSHADEPST